MSNKFKPGKSGNPEGRPPGSKSKTSEEFRRMIKAFLEKNWEGMQSDFDKASPQFRLTFRKELMRYVTPEAISFDKLTESQLNELYEYTLKRIKGDE